MMACQVEIWYSVNNGIKSCCVWLDLLWFSLPITGRGWIALMNTLWFTVRVPHDEDHTLSVCFNAPIRAYGYAQILWIKIQRFTVFTAVKP